MDGILFSNNTTTTEMLVDIRRKILFCKQIQHTSMLVGQGRPLQVKESERATGDWLPLEKHSCEPTHSSLPFGNAIELSVGTAVLSSIAPHLRATFTDDFHVLHDIKLYSITRCVNLLE